MKVPRTHTTAKAGVIFVEQIVNAHGSVFRQVHQEDDYGIDGFIEIVEDTTASGLLIAVQVKSGESYLNETGEAFDVPVDQHHLQYWLNFSVPVIIVCYDPNHQRAAWISVRDYVENERYHEREPITRIHVPVARAFNQQALATSLTGLARVRADERKLLRTAEQCLSDDASARRAGFEVLTQHPDSRDLRITFFVARQLLMDSDVGIARQALYTLGFGIGRHRWSFDPNNGEERKVIANASSVAEQLNEQEIRHVIELVDDEAFRGPDALGERCFDVLCCSELAWRIMDEIIEDEKQPIQRRGNCLYMQYDCDDAELEEAASEVSGSPAFTRLLKWMLGGDAKATE